MHIIRFIFYKGGSLQGDFSIKPSERVNSLVCISVRIKVNEWINKTTPNTQWSLSVFCSLPPPPSISPSCQPSFTADSEICLSPRPALSPSHAALVPDIKWPLNPPRSAQVPTSSFEQPPALPRLAPHGDARHLPVWEREAFVDPLPVCQRIILACHAIQHLLFSTGRAKERKNESGENERAWERERSAETFSWISDALLFVPDCPTDTCNRFYPPMFTL